MVLALESPSFGMKDFEERLLGIVQKVTKHRCLENYQETTDRLEKFESCRKELADVPTTSQIQRLVSS